MGAACGGEIQKGAKVQGQSRVTFVVPPGTVYQEDIGALRQSTHRRFQQRPFPKKEEPRLVGRSGPTSYYSGARELTLTNDGRTGNGRVALSAGS